MTQEKLCDKCERPVKRSNSVVQFQGIIDKPYHSEKDRHLYQEGICEGSPSRVRRIERDPVWAEAYLKLQAKAGK